MQLTEEENLNLTIVPYIIDPGFNSRHIFTAIHNNIPEIESIFEGKNMIQRSIEDFDPDKDIVKP